MAVATAAACLLAGGFWFVAVVRSRRELSLAAVALVLLGPVAVSLWLGDSKTGTAAAAAAFLPGLLACAPRRSAVSRSVATLAGNAFGPFAVLYLAAGLTGLTWGLLRGNSPVLTLGQTATAALFFAGFAVAGPLMGPKVSSRSVVAFAVIVGAMTLPGILPFLAWVVHPGQAHFMRYLGHPALFAPLLVLVLMAGTYRRHPVATLAAALLFGLVTLLTFTRSYWLGLVAGSVLLGMAVVAGAARRPRSHPGGGRRAVLLAVCAGACIGIVAVTPLGRFAVQRVGQTRPGSFDLSVVVRSYELHAAWASIKAHPILGIGAGGEFESLYQVGATNVFFGRTNFIHNAYLYLPLKFGFIGIAAFAAFVAGLAACIVRMLTDAARMGAETAAFPAAFTALAVLSITAPNLVDPRYSVFAGLLAYLAGSRAGPAFADRRLRAAPSAAPSEPSRAPREAEGPATGPAIGAGAW